jgi:peptide/nickel transport system substrate-binding protein
MRTALRWLAISSLLLAMTAESGARTRPHYGGTLRLEMGAANWQDNDALFPLVAETLTYIDADGETHPLLATRWESQNGARRWLFTIRPGVEWHDGLAVTSEAVADSLRKAARGPELEGCRISASGMDAVVMESDTPMLNLPALLALRRFPIVRGDQGTPLGTGPFRVSRSSEYRTTLEAFDHYWHGRPYLDSIEITAGRSIRDQWMDAGIHRADIVTVPAEMLRRAQQERLRPVSSGNVDLIALQASPIGGTIDVLLRQALAATVDRAALLNFIFQKQGEVASGLLPNWLSGYATLFPSAPDAARVHDLRAQAGQSRPLTIGYPAGDTTLQLVAERIALNARESGLQAQVTAGSADFAVVHLPLSSTNPQLALAALAAPTGARRADYGEGIEELYRNERDLLSQAKLIPLLCLPRAYAVADQVRDARVTALGQLDLSDAWIEEHR